MLILGIDRKKKTYRFLFRKFLMGISRLKVPRSGLASTNFKVEIVYADFRNRKLLRRDRKKKTYRFLFRKFPMGISRLKVPQRLSKYKF